MRFEWDAEKDAANQKKHGLSFDEAKELFLSGVWYAEFFDERHVEPRFVAVGPITSGVIAVICTIRKQDLVRIISARYATDRETKRYQEERDRSL